MGNNYICKICGRNFGRNSSLIKHDRVMHNNSMGVPIKEKQIKCGLCSEVFTKYIKYRAHLKNVHNIDDAEDQETLLFNNENDFQIWLQEIERTNNISFVNRRGTNNNRRQYNCSRSGNFIPKNSMKKRHLKLQGSSKVGYTCPATLSVILGERILVTHFKKHLNHDRSLSHMRLTKNERAQIADKLIQGVSPSSILKDIRLSIADTVERVHLTSRKDLHNIKKSFGISGDLSQIEKSSTCQTSAIPDIIYEQCEDNNGIEEVEAENPQIIIINTEDTESLTAKSRQMKDYQLEVLKVLSSLQSVTATASNLSEDRWKQILLHLESANDLFSANVENPLKVLETKENKNSVKRRKENMLEARQENPVITEVMIQRYARISDVQLDHAYL